MTKRDDIVKSAYRRANELTDGTLGILRDAVERFGEAQAARVAAGLAYYTMFSLFPLLLALIAADSFLLQGEAVSQKVVRIVGRAALWACLAYCGPARGCSRFW